MEQLKRFYDNMYLLDMFLLNNEPTTEQEQYLFYMLEKEKNEINETIKILIEKLEK